MLFGIAKGFFIKYNVCFGKGKDVTELGLGYSFDVVGWCQGIRALAVAKGFVLMDRKPSINGLSLARWVEDGATSLFYGCTADLCVKFPLCHVHTWQLMAQAYCVSVSVLSFLKSGL